MPIIGLIGLKNSGKDTLANSMEFDTPTFRLKFARGIKVILEDFFNLPPRIYENSYLKEVRYPKLNNHSPREIMIQVGSLFRKYNDNIWVDYLTNEVEKIRECHDTEPLILITDVRFDNEVKCIVEDLGGILVDIDRKDLYAKEKKIIEILGVNFLSRLIMRFVNPSLSRESEWNYFKLRRIALHKIDNTDLRHGILKLQQLLDLRV